MVILFVAAEYSFPYVLKRVPVKDRQVVELTPIEVAIDEMQTKLCEFEEVVVSPIDIKKLQLRLQGAVAVQVNAGPLAYASAFLDPKLTQSYPLTKINELKEVFRYVTLHLSICLFDLFDPSLNYISLGSFLGTLFEYVM